MNLDVIVIGSGIGGLTAAARLARYGKQVLVCEKVAAIGPETLKAIAQAGPEMQAKLLQALGLQSVLITDGRNPINLFSTAQGLINPISSQLPSESQKS